MPRKKAEPKPPKIDRKDWRNLPTAEWNTATVLAYFSDMNREKFGVEPYVPFRNWSIERGMIKRELDRYGPEVMREVFDQAFAEYKATRQYPMLTAGFVISYVSSRLLPRILAERDTQTRREHAEGNAPTFEQVAEWL